MASSSSTAQDAALSRRRRRFKSGRGYRPAPGGLRCKPSSPVGRERADTRKREPPVIRPGRVASHRLCDRRFENGWTGVTRLGFDTSTLRERTQPDRVRPLEVDTAVGMVPDSKSGGSG